MCNKVYFHTFCGIFLKRTCVDAQYRTYLSAEPATNGNWGSWCWNFLSPNRALIVIGWFVSDTVLSFLFCRDPSDFVRQGTIEQQIRLENWNLFNNGRMDGLRTIVIVVASSRSLTQQGGMVQSLPMLWTLIVQLFRPPNHLVKRVMTWKTAHGTNPKPTHSIEAFFWPSLFAKVYAFDIQTFSNLMLAYLRKRIYLKSTFPEFGKKKRGRGQYIQG